MIIERVWRLQERSGQHHRKVGIRTYSGCTSSHNNFWHSEVRRSWVSTSIIIGMVKADAVQSLLFRMEGRAQDVFRGDTIEISLTFLAQLGLNQEEATDALILLSTQAGYKCIELTQYQTLQIADDGFQTVDVLAKVKLLPNYKDIQVSFQKYYDFKRKPDNAIMKYRNEDWQSLERQFEDGGIKLDWSVKPLAEVIDLSQSMLNPVRLRKAQVSMQGNDIYLQFSDGTKAHVKHLRTDQAPAYFMRYMLVHPNTVIIKAVIQTDVEMCSQKQDMTELVRQCGFDKNLKPFFFSGTTKDKVYFTPDSEVSDQIVSQMTN